MSQEAANVIVAMIALGSPQMPPLARLLSDLKQDYPACPAPTEVTEDDTVIQLKLRDSNFTIALLPAPIPWSNLEGPCRAAWWWPQATQEMQSHQSHLIVACIGGTGSAVERHCLLSYLVGALTSSADAKGVFWGNGTLVHDPKEFRRRAAQSSTSALTPELWIDMRLAKNDDGSFRYFTTGMNAFGCLEIEIDASRKEPQEIMNFCYDMICYLLDRGASVDDGETIGRSSEEKIKVSHAPSMWDREPVMKLEFV